jgi:GDP-4-dehydro-6-deoxy-D-mannose reductase
LRQPATAEGRSSTVNSPIVLVTGAAGFAGSHLLDLLAHDPVRVVAWRRPGIGAEMQASYPDVEWRELELLDAEAVRRELAALAPSHLYHLAGAPHVGNSWKAAADTLAINVLATHHIFEALRVAGLGTRVMVPSSAYVYKPADHPLREDDDLQATSPYGMSKIAAEQAAARAAKYDGLPVVVSRSFNHIGPRQDPGFFASAVARQVALIERGTIEPVIKIGNLETSRDFTDVRDTVRAYKALVERGEPGRIYNVCSGRPTKVRALLDGLVALSSVPLTIEVDPERFRPNDTPVIVGDPGRIETELGWAPQVPMEQTLRDLLDYWRDVARRQS